MNQPFAKFKDWPQVPGDQLARMSEDVESMHFERDALYGARLVIVWKYGAIPSFPQFASQ